MVQSLSCRRAIAWQGRVQRFASSGMTLERFCKEEGVSASSFHRWRKRLAQRRTLTCDDEQTPAFRAVRVTPTDMPVAIQLPDGARVEVPTADLDVVRAVLGEILRHDAKRARGESRC